MNNIILIGMMGSGKSSVGQAIAKSSAMPFIDTDEMIVQRQDMGISHIFECYGEAYFRKLEAEMAAQAAAMDHMVIATGGGMVINEQNMAALGASGLVVYLRCSINCLHSRLIGDESRPLLEKLEDILAQRAALYEKYSDLIVDGEGEIGKVAEMILDEYRSNKRA